MIMNSAGDKKMTTMTIATAREIMATVLRRNNAADSLGGLLAERERYLALGDTALAGSVSRTIEDLVGHWHDGAFVGAVAVAEAARVTRWAGPRSAVTDAQETQRQREMGKLPPVGMCEWGSR